MNISFYTLGCKANQFDTQAMEQIAAKRGHKICGFDESWDACIINTCTVTATSDKKSRQIIRQAKRMNPDGVVAVCGCYAQMSPDDVDTLGVDVIGGAVGKESFLEAVEKAIREKKKSVIRTVLDRKTPFEILDSGCLSGRTRALMKVQDGCDNYCTYCIIPYSRGHIRSMPVETAVSQIVDLEKDGYREVVITGIEISSYGADQTPQTGLIDLLEAISLAAPTIRIRLGSLEPRTVTDEFCQRLVPLTNICRHFHLSMQSGCDATLKRMHRRYDTERYFESVTLLRKYFPGCSITTDMITGFPEETEEEFTASLAFITKCAFSSMHIFPYSVRKGTPAASMPQIEKSVKEERAKRASVVAKEMTKKYLEAQIGSAHSILFEIYRDGFWYGHTETYLETAVASDLPLHNEIKTVKIEAVQNGILLGVIK